MNKIFYGDILYSCSLNEVKEYKNAYLVCSDSKIKGIYNSMEEIPEEFKDAKLLNYESKIIIPGFVDLHLHAPQFPISGYQVDLELLDWLNQYIFPEESKYKNIDYAKVHYKRFVDELKKSSTCYFSMFGSIHTDSDLLLMDMMEESNLVSYVGKVNMNRNSPDFLVEETNESIEETIRYIEKSRKYKNTMPIITPRFIPSCSDDLMNWLGDYANSNDLAIQSHLDENPNEIAWVKKLVPDALSYTDAYKKFSCLNDKTIMAHCVWMEDSELKLIKESGTYIAHCPISNSNLSSGVAPIRKYLNLGLNVGLGSDIAAGHTLDMFEIMTNTVSLSKLYWRYNDKNLKPLCFKEAFYLATAGGGKYFGKVGKLEPDYDASIVVLDDSYLEENCKLPTLIERLERMSYVKDYKQVCKYCRGIEIK